MPEIEIRPAVITDLPVLQDIDRSYQTDYVWQMDRALDEGQVAVHFRTIRLPRSVRVEYPYTPNMLADEWAAQPAVLVAWLEGVPVGYVRIKEQVLPGAAWISELAVGKSARRYGIGSGLVLAAQEWALQRRLHRMVIEMQSKNYPAIQMGLKLGYEFYGYLDHYYANRDIALFFTRFLH